MVERWAVLWQSTNSIDGRREHFVCNMDCNYALFRTRREAREFIDAKYGYIRSRIDLQSEPFGWRIPKAVRVTVNLTPIKYPSNKIQVQNTVNSHASSNERQIEVAV